MYRLRNRGWCTGRRLINCWRRCRDVGEEDGVGGKFIKTWAGSKRIVAPPSCKERSWEHRTEGIAEILIFLALDQGGRTVRGDSLS